MNSLPLEMTNKIVDFVVEEEEWNSRPMKKSLFNLALVSKRFTLQSQKGLWRYMRAVDVPKVKELIKSGFGRDKVVEYFDMFCTVESLESEVLADIFAFFQGVLEVRALEMQIQFHNDYVSNVWFDLSSVASLRALRTIKFSGFLPVKFPPYLTKLEDLTMEAIEDSDGLGMDESTLFRTMEGISKTTLVLDALDILFIESIFSISFRPQLHLENICRNLRSLSLHECDHSLGIVLLPLCHSLSHFGINRMASYVPILPQLLSISSDRLTSLAVSYLSLTESALLDKKFFRLPAFSQLKEFYLYYHCEGDRELRWKEMKEIDSRCRTEGIKAYFCLFDVSASLEKKEQNTLENSIEREQKRIGFTGLRSSISM